LQLDSSQVWFHPSQPPDFVVPSESSPPAGAHGVISVMFAVYGKEAVRIISMRPASKAEREFYEANRR
jgi:hypothetical protein